MSDETSGGHVLAAAALVAGAVHLVLDWLTSRTPFTTPPYLLLDHAGQAFRDLLALDRATILVVVAVISAGVNGAIAGLFGAAMAHVRRRMLKLWLVLSALWLFSGVLMILVYLSLPIGIAAGSLAAGIPRAFAVAWILDWVLARRGAPPRPA